MNQFKDVSLYRNRSDSKANFEYLFNLTNKDGEDPSESSLFNLDTLKELIKVGEETVDVTEDKEA